MRRSHLYAATSILAVGVVAGCNERVVQPNAGPAAITEADSAAMFAEAATRPPGLMLAPVATEGMVVLLPADSFTIELTARECAAPNNWVVVTNPGLDTLSSTMCQEPVDTVWSFTDGPYDEGTEIILEFESGFDGGGIYDGKVKFSDTLSASFPEWNLEFEDAADDDFDDFLLRVVAYPDTATRLVLLSSDTTLHPAITRVSPVNGGVQPKRDGDVASLKAILWSQGAPVIGDTVSFRAEVAPLRGGHSHYGTRHSLTEFPEVPQVPQADPDLVGTALPAHFRNAGVRIDSVDVVTDTTGSVEVEFVAGYLGAKIDVMVTAEIDTVVFADTVSHRLRVPDLVDIQPQFSQAYFVGGTTSDGHPQGTNWYMESGVVPRMEAIIDGLYALGSGSEYPQVNDASLPWGGSMTASVGRLIPVGTSTSTVDDPFTSHRSHALGVDVDIAFCYSTVAGMDANQANRVHWTRPDELSPYDCYPRGEAEPRPDLRLNRVRTLQIMNTQGDAQMHVPGPDANHFHIRFWEN